MPDEANIQLVLAKLPSDGLARKLVTTFASEPSIEAVKAGQAMLAKLMELHLKEGGDDTAEEA